MKVSYPHSVSDYFNNTDYSTEVLHTVQQQCLLTFSVYQVCLFNYHVCLTLVSTNNAYPNPTPYPILNPTPVPIPNAENLKACVCNNTDFLQGKMNSLPLFLPSRTTIVSRYQPSPDLVPSCPTRHCVSAPRLTASSSNVSTCTPQEQF